jgi:glycosyltransferase involved in cell wall biosynthesis
VPTVVTLHDLWWLTGHCAIPFSCKRWQIGCGSCPDLKIPLAVPRDETARNWKRKRQVYAHSRLYVAAPSQWMLDHIPPSILQHAAVETRVIPYGIPLQLYAPTDKRRVRAALGLDPDVPVIMASASGIINSPYKDYPTMLRAVERIAQQHPQQKLVFLVVGDQAPGNHIENTEIRIMGRVSDEQRIAQLYQAADVFIHAAHMDNFPNVILEAMATGTPVVATAVCGIREQVREGETGFLVPHADAPAMAARIQQILDSPPLAHQLGENARRVAIAEYDQERQMDRYLEWYEEIRAARAKKN